MATGQTILDTMEVLNNELQLQSGEADVTRALRAVNVAQDYLESLLVARRFALPVTITTGSVTAGSATTTFPTGFLRVDRVQMLNRTTLLPEWDLTKLPGPPLQARNTLSNLLVPSGGRPMAYWSTGSLIYWDPVPQENDTVRIHGLQAASDVTASGTFAYPDYTIIAVAAFAAYLMKIGVGDVPQDIVSVAKTTFEPVLDQMDGFLADSSPEPVYRDTHIT